MTFQYNAGASPEARTLFDALKRLGVRAELEKWDGHKTIDIAITRAMVNIEVDGKHHNSDPKQALKDLKRTCYSFQRGYLTLRIPNCLITENLEETAQCIRDFLDESEDQLDSEY